MHRHLAALAPPGRRLLASAALVASAQLQATILRCACLKFTKAVKLQTEECKLKSATPLPGIANI